MILRIHRRKDKRTISTLCGPVTYSRAMLRPYDKESKEKLKQMGKESVYPMDECLGIDGLPFKMTVPMMLECAWYGTTCRSYQKAEETLLRVHKLQINDDTLRAVTNYVGRLVYFDDCKKAYEAERDLDRCKLPSSLDIDDVLYMMTDGAALNTRTLAKGTDSSWVENKLAVVFRKSNIREYTYTKTDDKGNTIQEKRHEILKREYISYTGPVDEFKWHVLALMVRNGYGKVKQTVIISDGSSWIKNMKEELFPDSVQILDLFHLKENTYEYAKAIFNNDEKKYKPWAAKMCKRLEEGKYQEVLKACNRHKDQKLLPGTVNLATYIENHKAMLDYPSYKAKGYFVGSGIIESAHKIVMQDRLKRSGMRWNVQTARYVLALKAKEECDLWEITVVPLVTKVMADKSKIMEKVPLQNAQVLKVENEALRILKAEINAR